MFSTDDLTLDCSTCLAANTTACGDCVVTHLLANDDGPIELEPVPAVECAIRSRETLDIERAIGLFGRAGLLGDDIEFVSQADFDAGRIAELV